MKRHQQTFFTGDQHFGHRAVINICQRPFADVDEMDQHMVQAWNSVVHADDVVWHLGDFSHRGSVERVESIFMALNGRKHIVLGNHDKQQVTRLPWIEQTHFKHIADHGLQVNLSHYAMRTWPAMHRKALMLFGHSHGTMPGSRYTHDVGVDAVGYVPLTLPELQARMALLPTVAYDVGRIVDDYDDKREPQTEGGFQP